MKSRKFTLLFIIIFLNTIVLAQNKGSKFVLDPELNQYISKPDFEAKGFTNSERKLRYRPEGQDFVINNGNKKFNRALYGSNTGFRVETGDVPEFALYLPKMGGNLSFYLSHKKQSIELNKAKNIESRYRAGSRIYTITDPAIRKGQIRITALATYDFEGIILKIETKNIPSGTYLSWIFGGCADKRFSREGDLGVDAPDSFELKPEYCKGNDFQINNNSFSVIFGAQKDKTLTGIFPEKSKLTINELPALKGKLLITKNNICYISIFNPNTNTKLRYTDLKNIFEKADLQRNKIASQIKFSTPDPYLNTLGSALSIAADGIWSGDTWLHGAVGWRRPLSGWRAAYTGDVLGWHDRAKTHFSAYAASQVNNVIPVFPHPAQDSALNLARSEKKWGTQMYSNGYICRNPYKNDQMHHYDMNLCYTDELLWHFNWTGDTAFMKKMWPTLSASLAWEKRNFDPDDDGLYDAYCCIWASDALYYNSGAVTHSSAYNYRANKLAAQVAKTIGENPEPYQKEADKILNALNKRLWLPKQGHWAEFQDFMGNKLIHENAAVWTIYHAIDSETGTAFQNYQATRYIDTEIPHFPIIADGIKKNTYQTISTSNWTPYSWSINNVAFAEVYHTTLAFWEAGRNNVAFQLLKSALLDGMYLGSSPGNVGQISYYDVARGECYRDFGDPIGVLSRVVIEGLYGIKPDLLEHQVKIRPGFPDNWNHAEIITPDIKYNYLKTDTTIQLNVKHHFYGNPKFSITLPVDFTQINYLKINGKNANWSINENAIEFPEIITDIQNADSFMIEISGSNKLKTIINDTLNVHNNDTLNYISTNQIIEIFDPQQIFRETVRSEFRLTGEISGEPGGRTLFIKVKNGNVTWWQPIFINILSKKPALVIYPLINDSSKQDLIDLSKFYNDSVTNIFKHKYLSPRSPYTTLQIPSQGIGEWCHPTLTAVIDDSGTRKLASNGNDIITTPIQVKFISPAKNKNIIFTSLWTNFPAKVTIPLSGNASGVYLLMAGSTNHMQSHLVNGLVSVRYTDGTSDTLNLINPENWCPIEQDYYLNDHSFVSSEQRPYRFHLMTGLVSNNLEKDLGIEGVYGREIKSGAGVILGLKLNKSKKLKDITLETVANEVIIGLMSLTLIR